MLTIAHKEGAICECDASDESSVTSHHLLRSNLQLEGGILILNTCHRLFIFYILRTCKYNTLYEGRKQK